PPGDADRRRQHLAGRRTAGHLAADALRPAGASRLRRVRAPGIGGRVPMSARLFAALLATAALAGCARQESPEEAIARAQQLIEAGKPGEARVRMKSLLVE